MRNENIAKEIIFTPSQSWSILLFFANALWSNRDKKYISDDELLCDYCTYLISDPASDSEWQKVCMELFGRKIKPNDSLNSNEVFSSMIEMCAFYIFHFGDSFHEILNLFYDMRYKPENHQEEWLLWQQSIEKVKAGETLQPFEFDE